MTQLSKAAEDRVVEKLSRNRKSELESYQVIRVARLMRDILYKAHDNGEDGFTDHEFACILDPECLNNEDREKQVLNWIADAKYFIHINQQEVNKIKKKK